MVIQFYIDWYFMLTAAYIDVVYVQINTKSYEETDIEWPIYSCFLGHKTSKKGQFYLYYSYCDQDTLSCVTFSTKFR